MSNKKLKIYTKDQIFFTNITSLNKYDWGVSAVGKWTESQAEETEIQIPWTSIRFIERSIS